MNPQYGVQSQMLEANQFPQTTPYATGQQIAEDDTGPRKMVDTVADATFNLNKILSDTITSNKYFLSLISDYPHFEQVLDVIRDECTHLDVFEPGKSHNPSVAFCCMYRLCMMQLDVGQLNFMLRHKNVMIRCVALLYLRCVGEPKQLFDWCERHLEDDTEFTPKPGGRPTTVAKWLLDLICSTQYCDTTLKRVAIPLVKTFEKKAMQILVRKERLEKLRKYLRVQFKCKAKWTDGNIYDAQIEEVMENRNFFVTYTEYGNQEEIPITDFVLDSVMDSLRQESASGNGPGSGSGSAAGGSREERKKKSRSRSRTRSRGRDKKKRSRSRSRSRDRKDKKRSRSRERERDRDRNSSRRDRDRGDRPRSRSASREKESKSVDSLFAMSYEEEVDRKLQEKWNSAKSNAVSSDGVYCPKNITSYKKSLSKQFKGGAIIDEVNKKLDIPDDGAPRHGSYGRGGDGRQYSRRSPSPLMQKKRELTQEQKRAQAQLFYKYGDAAAKRPAGQ